MYLQFCANSTFYMEKETFRTTKRIPKRTHRNCVAEIQYSKCSICHVSINFQSEVKIYLRSTRNITTLGVGTMFFSRRLKIGY